MNLGPYVVEKELGRGGMGIVYAGRAPEGAPVALKVLLKTTKKETLARFDRERRLQGALGEAAGFVPVVDVGDSAEGPWLAMPLVPGGTLRSRLERGALAIGDAVELLRALASAVGKAHALGIVHRDLKPENVLFTQPGAETGDWGRPLVSDLGLAKHFSTEAPGASHSVALSRTGELLGTAGYMAPEQMNDARAVGPPANVFSLGAILYECLAGEPAFEADSIHGVFAKVALGEYEPLRKKRADAPRWLVQVVERALAKSAADRFADGTALAAALVAPPARSRTPLVAGAVLVMAVAVVLLAFSRRETPSAETVATVASSSPPPTVAPLRSLTIGGHGDSIRSLALSPRGDLIVSACDDKKVRIFSTRDGSLQKTLEGHGGEVLAAAYSPRGDLVGTGSHDGMLLLWDPLTGDMLRTCLGSEKWTSSVAISPEWVACGSLDGSVRLYKTRPGHDMSGDMIGEATLRPDEGSPVNAVVFSPDGRLLATASNDKKVRLWTVSPPTVVATLEGHTDEPLSVAFSPRGDLVASGGRDRTIRIWSVKEKTELRKLVGHRNEVQAAVFSPSGSVLVSGSADGTVRYWSVEGGREIAQGAPHRGIVYTVVAAPDFEWVASAGEDHVIRIEGVPREVGPR